MPSFVNRHLRIPKQIRQSPEWNGANILGPKNLTWTWQALMSSWAHPVFSSSPSRKKINYNLLLGNHQWWRCSKIHVTYTRKKGIDRKTLDYQSWGPKAWPNILYLWGYGRLGMKNWEPFLLSHCIIWKLWLTLITRRCIFYTSSWCDTCIVYAPQWKNTLSWMVPLRTVYASRHSENIPLPW